jgi:hypothetical protein
MNFREAGHLIPNYNVYYLLFIYLNAHDESKNQADSNGGNAPCRLLWSAFKTLSRRSR